MKIISHIVPEDETYATVQFKGGENDGTVFQMVQVLFENGEFGHAYICNCKEGYFRNVFVPWDSKLPIVPK